MPRHFARFLEDHSSPGLIVIAHDADIGGIIEDLLIVWAASEADEWKDAVAYLPL